MRLLQTCLMIPALLGVMATATMTDAAEPSVPAVERFARLEGAEVPDFQRHVLPTMGRLGCNSRSCHGSFQGQGDFRLSLFGYDFESDHKALLAKGEDRVDPEAPELSLILQKPTQAIPHKGGTLTREGEWTYNLLSRWIAAGAKPAAHAAEFERLEVTPERIVCAKGSKPAPLRVIACWSDGTREDVTCLSRFQSNDESIATVTPEGVVTSAGAGDTHVVAFYDNGVAAIPVLRPVSKRAGDRYPEVPTPTEIDRLVVSKLRTLGIVPSDVCDDATFLRRASLDLTGSLPTPERVEAFLADTDPEKRAKLVDGLLASPLYAAYWTNALCDQLGISAANFQGMFNAPVVARNWYAWIERRVQENEPYDALIAGMVLGRGREPGQSYEAYMEQESAYYRKESPADYAERETTPYFWARRNLRQPEEKALAFSYAFLGVRLECAQCHKHPFDQWTQQDFDAFKAFFEPIRYGPGPEGAKLAATIREELAEKVKAKEGKAVPVNGNQLRQELERRAAAGEVVPIEDLLLGRPGARARGKGKGKANGNTRVPASVLGGEDIDLAGVKDPRQPLMDWMRDPENPYLARAFVNRTWAALLGVGIVDPPDDANLANPPSNGPLLDYLASEFVAHDFDMKWLLKTIVMSDTYQRSWEVNETNALDSRNYSHAPLRRMRAEALIDAVRQATASPQLMAKMAEDPAIRAFGPGSTAQPRGAGAYAARVFGKSTRDTNCDCARSDEPNLLQAIFLQNDSDVLSALDRPDGWLATVAGPARGPAGDPAQRVRAIQRRLSRLDAGPATRAERQRLQRALAQARAAAGERAQQPAASADVDPEALVREAFLRTFSRPPTAEERAAALEHFEAADDPSDGLRDLLWALINTKEFVTNH